EHIIRMAARGGCFIGASLSCVDLLVYLFSKTLNISPSRCNDPDRDYFFLSKGHDVPALYGILAELGYLDPARLNNHCSPQDVLYWHPNRQVPGVEFHSGSLGHLLSVSMGVALDILLRGGKNRVFVMLGDGELNEGSVWEACLVASAFRLQNLVPIVDRNGIQANARPEELIPLEPLTAKFESFNWIVQRSHGHHFEEMHRVFSDLPFSSGKPCVVIADTVRGRGVKSLEDRVDRWFAKLTQAQAESLLDELHGKESGMLSLEALVVR